MVGTFYRFVCLLPFVFCLLSSPSAAQVVDGVCHFPWWQTEWNVALMGPIGQEFTAARDRLNFVDLWLAESASQPATVELVVRVRSGELGGALLGESRVSMLPDGFNDFHRFSFHAPVPLVVGETYVLEIVRTSPDGVAMIRGADNDPCADGRAYILGEPREFSDLWYQVGWDAALPLERSSWGALKARH